VINVLSVFVFEYFSVFEIAGSEAIRGKFFCNDEL